MYAISVSRGYSLTDIHEMCIRDRHITMKDTIKHTYLAADFGGGSGRIIAGFLLNGRLELEEIYRFSNRQVDVYKRQHQYAGHGRLRGN